MDLNETYAKIWERKLVDAQDPARQSIDRVNWTTELFPESKTAGPLLDIGTGSGAMLARGKALGWTVCGTDVSERASRWLGGQGFDVWTLDANRDRIPLEDGTMGVVTLCDVIEHLTDPGHALAEAFRVLRPGGMLYVATPNCAYWVRVASLAAGSMFRTSGDPELRDGGHVAYYAPGDLAATLSGAGFRVEAIRFRKADPCPSHLWPALQTLGARKREWSEYAYMIGVAKKP